MAHSATINTHTEALIKAITGLTPHHDGRQYRSCRDSALRTYRSHQHTRVNQFAVQARLEGLEEKFAVVNNDALADALHTQLDELAERPYRWKPEVLSLLLSLSDRPAEKSNVSSLGQASEPEEAVDQLTWAEIIADDPLDEEGLWDDVDAESDYSDPASRAFSDDDGADRTTSTQASSVGEENLVDIARSFIVPKDDSALGDVESTAPSAIKLSRQRPSGPQSSLTQISELQAIREAVMMLHGSPSSVFATSHGTEIRFRHQHCSGTIASSTFDVVMTDFAVLGSELSALRHWLGSLREDQLLQRLHASLQERLISLKKDMSSIEQQYLVSGDAVVVSMLDVLSTAERLSAPLLRVFRLVCQRISRDTPSWAFLDALFDYACEMDLIDEVDTFCYVSSIFFECLEVYLRPIRSWILAGELPDHDQISFIRDSQDKVHPGSLWHSRFSLKLQSSGQIEAPHFMRSQATSIFRAGKRTMFLNALTSPPVQAGAQYLRRHTLDSAAIMQSLQQGLLPFAGVVENKLRAWVETLVGAEKRNLCQVMLTQCGLQEAVTAIHNLYLCRDGSRLQAFSDKLFYRMDRGKPWTDRFILTDTIQSTLGAPPYVNPERITARARNLDPAAAADAANKSTALGRLVVDYAIPWPLQNIIRTDFPGTLQLAFTLFLRLYRAEYVLSKIQLDLNTGRRLDSMTRSILALRQRLTWFVSVFRTHVSQATASAMDEFRKGLSAAHDIDDMVAAYDRFRCALETRLLLGSNVKPIMRALSTLLLLCEDCAAACASRFGQSGALEARRRTGADDAEDVSDDDVVGHDEGAAQRPLPDIANLRSEFDRQLSFALAGLRSLSRVGGEPFWIMLAETLHAGVEHLGDR